MVHWKTDHQRREGIYFDGALPAYKKSIRHERSQNYVEKLITFKTLHDAAGKASKTSNTSVYSTPVRLSGVHKDLPPPPFLVPAVLEALHRSAFADRIYLVDGEADTFCAAAALQQIHSHGPDVPISIFSNDSDLLVYDTGPQTRVILINEVQERDFAGNVILEGFGFLPALLRKHGDQHGHEALPDLVRPAFAMREDPHMTFQQALLTTKEALEDDVAYSDFANEYDLSDVQRRLETLKHGKSEGDLTCDLDPRISEVLQQARAEERRLEMVHIVHRAEILSRHKLHGEGEGAKVKSV